MVEVGWRWEGGGIFIILDVVDIHLNANTNTNT